MSEAQNNVAVCVSWQTAVMKAPGFLYYHKPCYDSTLRPWPSQTVREVAVAEVSKEATCMVCGKKLREEAPTVS